MQNNSSRNNINNRRVFNTVRIPRDINYNQRTVLDLYVNMYNSTLRQIDSLQENLNEIKHNIDYLVGLEDEYIPNLRETNRDENIGSLHSIHVPSSLGRINNTLNSPPSSSINYVSSSNSSNSSNLLNLNNIINENLNNVVNLLNSYSNNRSVPNDEVISRSTRLIIYSEIENPINDRCPISRELFQPNEIVTQIHHCGHIFNNNEINTWFERNLHCPVCRYNIRDYVLTRDGSGNILNENNIEDTTRNSVRQIRDGSGNILNENIGNILDRYRYDIRYDISGNYLLFETFYRNI
jgi:hypothetical protein